MIDAGDTNVVVPGRQLLAKLCVDQKTLLGIARYSNRQIVVRIEREIIGYANPHAAFIGVAETGDQKTAFALDGVIGDGEDRDPGDRPTEQFEAGPFEPQCSGFAIAKRPDGP